MRTETLLFIVALVGPAVGADATDLSTEQQVVVDSVVARVLTSRYEQAFGLIDSVMDTPAADPVFPMLRLSATVFRDMDVETVVDSQLFEQAYAEALHVLDQEEASGGGGPYTTMLRGYVLANVAAHDLRQRRYGRAVSVGLEALRLLDSAAVLDSTNAEIDFVLGLYDVSRADLRKRLWWVLFWLPGDHARGVQRLERCVRNGRITAVAAELTLVEIYTRDGRLAEANRLLEGLLERFPGSRFVLWGEAKHYEMVDNPRRAAETYGLLAASYDTTRLGAYNAVVCRQAQVRLLADAGDVDGALAVCERLEQQCREVGDGRVADVCREGARLCRKVQRRDAR
jgi:hypothetical protein